MQLTDAPGNRFRSEASGKPLPTPYDGWIQDSVAATARAEPKVRGWIAALTPCQRDPSAAGCGTAANALTAPSGAGAVAPVRRALLCRVE